MIPSRVLNGSLPADIPQTPPRRSSLSNAPLLASVPEQYIQIGNYDVVDRASFPHRDSMPSDGLPPRLERKDSISEGVKAPFERLEGSIGSASLWSETSPCPPEDGRYVIPRANSLIGSPEEFSRVPSPFGSFRLQRMDSLNHSMSNDGQTVSVDSSRVSTPVNAFRLARSDSGLPLFTEERATPFGNFRIPRADSIACETNHVPLASTPSPIPSSEGRYCVPRNNSISLAPPMQICFDCASPVAESSRPSSRNTSSLPIPLDFSALRMFQSEEEMDGMDLHIPIPVSMSVPSMQS
eukprot:CAMPEP_0184670652 /NCGR_PEP_ID=MMETSP0308-20130426/83137_1 /TAXON_ID=38269 /ORGANISM="Gloeochaete witrockiana, Strain SAG 46.84" /LENGTH=295 /DNA_ID=CAMNT_0027117479 /DNA_START=238 /DNA_END=1125 /DNA_ORIENTATION=+